MKISYIEGDQKLINEVEKLWYKLNSYHTNNSKYFKDYFEEKKFESRKEAILEKSKDGKVKIDLVIDEETDKNIGYCISTIDENMVGEIDSLYLENEYRGLNLGDKLMKKAIDWLEENEVNSMKIGVSVGNDKVIKFYGRYGFYPRATILYKK